MEDFPTNSHEAQDSDVEPKKKVEKVIEGKVIRKKQPLSRKFTEMFIGGDSRTVGSYLWYDVFLPATKDTIADLMTQGVERMLFGEVKSTSRRPRNRGGSSYGPVNYTRYSSSTPPWERKRDDSRRPNRKERSAPSLDDIILDTRTEAEEVIERLYDLISSYDMATVADFYELIGEQSTYVDQKWGWTELRRPDIIRRHDGYRLKLPRPEPID